MEGPRIERKWRYNRRPCKVIWNTRMGFRCGYVAVREGSPLYELDYSDEKNWIYDAAFDLGMLPDWRIDAERTVASPESVIEVHGGVTFSGRFSVISWLWWFGYDCGHLGDQTMYSGGVLRSLDYCVTQCETMADQIDRLEGKWRESR